jgi:hypothetical protein
VSKELKEASWAAFAISDEFSPLNIYQKDYMKTHALLLTLLAAGAMTACGGGSDSSADTAGGTTGSTAGSTNYSVYSASGATDPSSATITSTANGSASVTVGSQSATITTSDASGNATAITGSFTKVVAFGGNAIGQFCGASTSGTNGFKSFYSFISASAASATLDELKGKSFNVYENCVLTQTATFNSDGTATFSGEGAATAAEVTQAFSSTGNLYVDNGVQGVTKAKIFKGLSNGVLGYAVIMVDRPNTANLSTGSTEILIQK